jgi:hypothetical protein
MKKLLITLAAIIISTTAFAQKKTTEVAVAKLPKATTDYIKDNLPGASITKAYKIEEKGDITYDVGIDVKGRKHQLIFDKDGKFLKKGDALIETSAPKVIPGTKPAQKTKQDSAGEAPKK